MSGASTPRTGSIPSPTTLSPKKDFAIPPHKIEHSKALADPRQHATDFLIVDNLYAHNYERNVLYKGSAARGDAQQPGSSIRASGSSIYNLMAEEWGDHPRQVGQVVAVGNAARAGQSTPPKVAFFELGGYGDVQYYAKDNIAVDQIGDPLPMIGRYTTSPAKIIPMDQPPLWPPDVKVMPAEDVQQYVLHNVGARPWDRTTYDERAPDRRRGAEGAAKIIDSQDDIHGYPVQTPTQRPFNPDDWNLEDMTPKTPAVLDSSHHARGT